MAAARVGAHRPALPRPACSTTYGPPPPPPPRPAPPAPGTEARYAGQMTANGAWGELRLGDRDVGDWLFDELGYDPGADPVQVELVVRVLDNQLAAEPDSADH